jgi:putative DNA-invertase from lambdoid prophage Rac
MIVLYARVSTTEQTTAHQRTQAEQAGFKIDKVVADEGISGVSTRLAERPEGKRLFDMLRAGDTLVVRWVDRLGRNYTDVVDTIREFMRRGVIIKTVINGTWTSDPMQQAVRDALIAFMAASGTGTSRGYQARPTGRHRPCASCKAGANQQPACGLSWPQAEL